jgi:hypothetical protein
VPNSALNDGRIQDSAFVRMFVAAYFSPDLLILHEIYSKLRYFSSCMPQYSFSSQISSKLRLAVIIDVIRANAYSQICVTVLVLM